MRNLKLTLAYDGADFSGWQVQPERQTVQGILAQAVARVAGESVLPQGSGRTDAGVHALAQVASFSLAGRIPAANLLVALNDVLPVSVRVVQVEEVPAEFHARASARAKTYRYRIFRGAICPPFLARYVYHCPWPLDEQAMIAAARLVEGEHDFSSFAAVDPERNRRICASASPAGTGEPRKDPIGNQEGPSNIRTIFCSQFRDDEDEFVYTVRGNGFLHHMVRNLVGTFLLVGKGALKEQDVLRILEARQRSANPGATAPAGGLYLMSVEY